MGKLVHRQPDVSALGRILDRIGEDVHQHLIQTVGVGQHVFVLHMGLHRKGLAALAGLLPDNAVQLADLLGNVHFFDVQGGLVGQPLVVDKFRHTADAVAAHGALAPVGVVHGHAEVRLV